MSPSIPIPVKKSKDYERKKRQNSLISPKSHAPINKSKLRFVTNAKTLSPTSPTTPSPRSSRSSTRSAKPKSPINLTSPRSPGTSTRRSPVSRDQMVWANPDTPKTLESYFDEMKERAEAAEARLRNANARMFDAEAECVQLRGVLAKLGTEEGSHDAPSALLGEAKSKFIGDLRSRNMELMRKLEGVKADHKKGRGMYTELLAKHKKVKAEYHNMEFEIVELESIKEANEKGARMYGELLAEHNALVDEYNEIESKNEELVYEVENNEVRAREAVVEESDLYLDMEADNENLVAECDALQHELKLQLQLKANLEQKRHDLEEELKLQVIRATNL